MLAKWWGELFKRPDGDDMQARLDKFKTAYEDWGQKVEQTDKAPQDIIGMELKAITARVTRKSGGPDGWSAELLMWMPDEAWDRLATILKQFEIEGAWPAELRQWRVVFAPKDGDLNPELTAFKVLHFTAALAMDNPVCSTTVSKNLTFRFSSALARHVENAQDFRHALHDRIELGFCRTKGHDRLSARPMVD